MPPIAAVRPSSGGRNRFSCVPLFTSRSNAWWRGCGGRSLLSLEIGFFDETQTGELLNRLSSDTSVLHLGAALGVRTFALLSEPAEWRWSSGRSETKQGGPLPWYPWVRAFRQPRPGDWETVVSRVRSALEEAVRGAGQ